MKMKISSWQICFKDQKWEGTIRGGTTCRGYTVCTLLFWTKAIQFKSVHLTYTAEFCRLIQIIINIFVMPFVMFDILVLKWKYSTEAINNYAIHRICRVLHQNGTFLCKMWRQRTNATHSLQLTYRNILFRWNHLT